MQQQRQYTRPVLPLLLLCFVTRGSYAQVEDARWLDGGGQPPRAVPAAGEIENMPLQYCDPAQVELTLKIFFQDCVIAAAPDSQSIFFRAKPADRDAIVAMIEKMENDAKAQTNRSLETAPVNRVNVTPIDLTEPHGDSSVSETAMGLHEYFAADSSSDLNLLQQQQLFLLRQTLLRERIAVQRKKLQLLEQQLNQRQSQFEELYGDVRESFDSLLLEETSIPEEAIEGEIPVEVEELIPLNGFIPAERAQNIQAFEGEMPQEEPDLSQEKPIALGEPALPVSVETEERGQPILPPPVEEEAAYAAAIREFGGFYELNDERHIAAINMVYHEDEDGTRYDNQQKENERVIRLLPKLKQLRKLYLYGGQVSDDSMRFVGKCKDLEVFFVWDATKLTDEGVEHLTELKNLTTIHISNAGLTDASLEIFSQLPNIVRLSLQQNKFSDAGLAFLAKSQKLKSAWLGLGASQFTDEGIRVMLDLDPLEEFGFQGSAVAQATIDDFNAAGVKLINPQLLE